MKWSELPAIHTPRAEVHASEAVAPAEATPHLAAKRAVADDKQHNQRSEWQCQPHWKWSELPATHTPPAETTNTAFRGVSGTASAAGSAASCEPTPTHTTGRGASK